MGRAVDDAVTKGHLVRAEPQAGGYALSTSSAHASEFFERTRDADNLDLLFVGRYRESWEQELFASEFGRTYVRNSVFPAIEQAYSVRLAHRPPSNPLRVLLEACPTAARLTRDFAPAPSNLVKETLLVQVVVTGALIDLHSDPDRLLDEAVRSAVRAITATNGALTPTVRLLEELALVGRLSHEQVSAAACPSEAAQAAMNELSPATDGSLSIHMTQSIPAGASDATHMHRLLLASQRAGTPIQLTAATDHDFSLKVEGDHEIARRDTTGVMVGIDPTVATPLTSIIMPARIEVNRTTRTIRLYMGQFSTASPTAYPVVVSLPASPPPGQHPRATFGIAIQWPELTVRDLRVLETANQTIQSGRARIEMILEQGDRLLGSLESPRGARLFSLGPDSANFQRALRGVEGELPAPVQVPLDSLATVGNMSARDRASHWQEARLKNTEKPRWCTRLARRGTKPRPTFSLQVFFVLTSTNSSKNS